LLVFIKELPENILFWIECKNRILFVCFVI